MLVREAWSRFGAKDEIDGAYLVGEHSDGTARRVSANKVPLAGALAVDAHDQALRAKVAPLSRATRDVIRAWACDSLRLGTTAIPEWGLICGCHRPRLVRISSPSSAASTQSGSPCERG
jgi:hypothetical protein